MSLLRSFFSHFTSLVMALFLAIIIWSVATLESNPSREGYFFDTLPVELVNLPNDLIVFEKSVERVRIKVRAPQVSFDQLRATSFRVSANLARLDVGEHKVPIQVQVSDQRVTIVAVEPPEIKVRLEPVKSRTLDVRCDVLDAPPIGFTYRAPTVVPAQVTISGAASLVDRVNEVSSDVYLRGAKATIEREITVQARDAQGNIISGLTISPTVVLVRVPVEQRVGYKDVSIKTVLKGTAASGYWISNIVVTPSTVTVIGNPDILAKIPGFVETVPIDVTGATADLSKRAVLSLPEGVSVLNNEGVTVQISVTPLLGGQTVRRKITVQNLKRGQTATISPDSVEVILSGPLPSLQNLAADDVQVVIDVTGLAAGVHQLKPRAVAVPGALRVQNIVPDTVQVTLADLSTPTPAPTFTPTLNTTPTLTIPTLTPTPPR
jgi:YbbR domain-containing protein